MAASVSLQNRVNPFGQIVAIAQRGMYTGNRGIIHNGQQQIVKPFALKAWITCTLKYKNVRREVMTGRKWTELFFLDEATAFAAGHRPCAFCRNNDFKQFKSLWLQANAALITLENNSMKTIDAWLHQERMKSILHNTYQTAILSSLPNGTMVALNNDTTTAHLWYKNKLLLWGVNGYAATDENFRNREVFVLTPPSIVNTFSKGYVPVVHPSAIAF